MEGFRYRAPTPCRRGRGCCARGWRRNEPPGDLGRRVRSLLDADGFEASQTCAVLLHLPAEAGAERVAVGGLGEEIDADAVRTAAGGIARLVQPIGGTIAWMLDDSLPLSAADEGSCGRRRADPGGVRPGGRPRAGRTGFTTLSSSEETRVQEPKPSAPSSSRAGRIVRAILQRAAQRSDSPPRWQNTRSRSPASPAGGYGPNRSAATAWPSSAAWAFLAVSQEVRGARARSSSLRPARRGRRRHARAGRQGSHLRHWRHLDQAGALHGGHEGRHVRRA